MLPCPVAATTTHSPSTRNSFHHQQECKDGAKSSPDVLLIHSDESFERFCLLPGSPFYSRFVAPAERGNFFAAPRKSKLVPMKVRSEFAS